MEDCEEAKDKAEILCEQYTLVFTKDDGRVPVLTVPYNLPSMTGQINKGWYNSDRFYMYRFSTKSSHPCILKEP